MGQDVVWREKRPQSCIPNSYWNLLAFIFIISTGILTGSNIILSDSGQRGNLTIGYVFGTFILNVGIMILICVTFAGTFYWEEASFQIFSAILSSFWFFINIGLSSESELNNSIIPSVINASIQLLLLFFGVLKIVPLSRPRGRPDSIVVYSILFTLSTSLLYQSFYGVYIDLEEVYIVQNFSVYGPLFVIEQLCFATMYSTDAAGSMWQAGTSALTVTPTTYLVPIILKAGSFSLLFIVSSLAEQASYLVYAVGSVYGLLVIIIARSKYREFNKWVERSAFMSITQDSSNTTSTSKSAHKSHSSSVHHHNNNNNNNNDPYSTRETHKSGAGRKTSNAVESEFDASGYDSGASGASGASGNGKKKKKRSHRRGSKAKKGKGSPKRSSPKRKGSPKRQAKKEKVDDLKSTATGVTGITAITQDTAVSSVLPRVQRGQIDENESEYIREYVDEFVGVYGHDPNKK